MKKTIVSLFCVLALCLGLLPTAALADDTWSPSTILYVGDVQLSGDTVSDTEGYYIQNEGGEWEKYTGPGTPSAPFFQYNGSGTLKLHGVNIQGAANPTGTAPHGTGIYLEAASGQVAALTLWLEGSSTVSGTHGIFVKADANASLRIGGDGSLTAAGTGTAASGITVQSGKQAGLTIEKADVTCTNAAGQGLLLQSGASSPAALAVNSGSLTVSGASAGIQYQFGTSAAGSGTPSLTVSGNAVVDAKNSGIQENSTADLQPAAGSDGTGGIVWNGKNATVYGNVTMQQSMTIGQGETLTIPQGAQLNTGLQTLTVNGGTVNGLPSGTVEYKVTGVTLNTDKLSLFTGDSETLTATVLPAEATNQNLIWGSDNGNVATADQNGKVTAVAPGTAAITVTTLDGNFKATCAVTVTDKTYALSADQTTLDFGAICAGDAQPAAQTVTITNTGNQTVTLNQPSAVNFQVGALSGTELAPNGTATFTVQPKAGLAVGEYKEELTVSNQNAGEVTLTLTFKVNPVLVTGLTLDKNTLALFAGDSATLTAAVTPDNATNKTLTWASSNTAVATVDQSGKVTAVAPGTAAITVTTNDGSGKVASCPVTVTAKTYALTIDPAAIGFGTVQPGYTQPAARQITVRNTGNQTLTLTQPTATKYLVGSLSRLTLAPGETATFTVQPKADQPVAVYNETILVVGNGGAGASLNLSFTVEKASGTSSGTASSSSSATTTTEKRTLHFDTNGGLPLDDVVRGLGAPVELWPYTPVRAGYLFQGWYADQALTQAVSSVVLTKDTTIYAKWAVDPAATAAPSGSGSGTGSSGSSGKGSGSQGGTTITVTPAPTASPTPTPEPTATPTPEPTATPEASAEPETDTDTASFPVVPVAAGVIVLVVLVGGIALYRRFHD